MLPKWPTIEVDTEQCRRWARQLRWRAIGLRVEPPLLVIDFDIPDRGILKAIEDITPSVVFEGLERFGNEPKTAFFLRMSEDDEPFHKLSTHRYTFAGTPKPSFAVEAFAGGGGGKQIGSFGPHSHDEHGKVAIWYRWVGDRSPANVRLDQLPVMTRVEVAALLDDIDALLASWPGLKRDENSTLGESFQAHVYDLDAQIFIDVEGSEYTLLELTAEAENRWKLKQANLRLTGSFTGDPTSTGSPRCKVWWSKKNGLSIVDYKTGVTHHPVGLAADPAVDAMLANIFTRGFGK